MSSLLRFASSDQGSSNRRAIRIEPVTEEVSYCVASYRCRTPALDHAEVSVWRLPKWRSSKPQLYGATRYDARTHDVSNKTAGKSTWTLATAKRPSSRNAATNHSRAISA
jgi:hypothetical protein